MHQISPFRMMHLAFIGLGISLLYGALSCGLLYFTGEHLEYLQFIEAYTISFRTIISLGLILATALVVFRTQSLIPKIIRDAFTDEQLKTTDYFLYEKRYLSKRRSINFAAEFVIIAFIVFLHCQFPLPNLAESLMVIAACAEYAFAVYAGRKLCYGGLMLHSLLKVEVTRNLFKGRELDEINSYVNIISTMTIIFVYVHVTNYYDAPFACNSWMGEAARSLLIMPAILATPVLLIFNFYPRIVLRKLYGESIDIAIKDLQKTLRNEELSFFERRSHLIEFEKMSRDELRYRLRLALSDLPIGITILIMVLEPLLGR